MTIIVLFFIAISWAIKAGVYCQCTLNSSGRCLTNKDTIIDTAASVTAPQMEQRALPVERRRRLVRRLCFPLFQTVGRVRIWRRPYEKTVCRQRVVQAGYNSTMMLVPFWWRSPRPRAKGQSVLTGVTYTRFVSNRFAPRYTRHISSGWRFQHNIMRTWLGNNSRNTRPTSKYSIAPPPRLPDIKPIDHAQNIHKSDMDVPG